MDRTRWYNPQLDPNAQPDIQEGNISFTAGGYPIHDERDDDDDGVDPHNPGLHLVGEGDLSANCISSWALRFHHRPPSTTTAFIMAKQGHHMPAIDIDPCSVSVLYDNTPGELPTSTLQFGQGLAEDEANDILLAFIAADLIQENEAWFADDIDTTSFGPFYAPVRAVSSSTAGHFHLYIDRACTWEAYLRLLEAMTTAELVEPGYFDVSAARGQTFLRLNRDKHLMPQRDKVCRKCWKPLEPGRNGTGICFRCPEDLEELPRQQTAFVGRTAPPNPASGQIWFNPATGITMVWSGIEWLLTPARCRDCGVALLTSAQARSGFCQGCEDNQPF